MHSMWAAACLRVFASSCVIVAALVAPSHADSQYEVDLRLVIAADVSGSMTQRLAKMQRDGFVAAFRNPALRNAIMSGPLGRIAVTYFEWSDERNQTVVVDWRLIDSADDLTAFAEELAKTDGKASARKTSISAALLFARGLIARSPYRSNRKVVDISGNGENNAGLPIASVIGSIGEASITVNGLAMPGNWPTTAEPNWYVGEQQRMGVANYYRREVRHGPGSFVVAVDTEDDIAEAILRKLVVEIAWLEQ